MIKGNILPVSRLKALRKSKRARQEDVSQHVGCTVKTYRKWEQGSGNEDLPSAYSLIKLAKYFNVSTDYILGLSDFTRLEYEDISHYTGLSEAAIKVMIDSGCGDLISQIITQPEFSELSDKIRRLCDNRSLESLAVLDEADNVFRGIRGERKRPVDNRRDSLKYRIGTLFAIIIERISTTGGENNG